MTLLALVAVGLEPTASGKIETQSMNHVVYGLKDGDSGTCKSRVMPSSTIDKVFTSDVERWLINQANERVIGKECRQAIHRLIGSLKNYEIWALKCK